MSNYEAALRALLISLYGRIEFLAHCEQSQQRIEHSAVSAQISAIEDELFDLKKQENDKYDPT